VTRRADADAHVLVLAPVGSTGRVCLIWYTINWTGWKRVPGKVVTMASARTVSTWCGDLPCSSVAPTTTSGVTLVPVQPATAGLRYTCRDHTQHTSHGDAGPTIGRNWPCGTRRPHVSQRLPRQEPAGMAGVCCLSTNPYRTIPVRERCSWWAPSLSCRTARRHLSAVRAQSR